MNTFSRYVHESLRLAHLTRADIGSNDHRQLGRMVESWREGSSHLDFLFGVTGSIVDDLRRAAMDKTKILSLAADMVPYLIGSGVWHESGYPSIALTHDFQRAALVTDFVDTDEPMLMPFPAFVLRLPEGLDGSDKAVNVFVFPAPTSVRGEIDFRAYRMTIARYVVSESYFTEWDNNMSFSTFTGEDFRFMPGSDIHPRHNEAVDIARRARRVLANTLLYIQMHGGLPRRKTLGAEVHVEREHGEAPRFRVGRPVKLGQQLRDAVKNGLSNERSWALMSRYVVRGHWRNQAYGKDWSLTRRRWIQPYWKGPANLTEALERTFQVGD